MHASRMPDSPRRPDLLRDAEARIRALTREVGTLKEDLRRECKRRERAIAQARQNEELRSSAEARVHELEYANRKLLAELESAKEVAKASSERDRKGMRVLREGLAVVERAVAARAHQGKALMAAAHSCMDTLKHRLLEPDPVSGSLPLSPGLELEVSVALTEASRALGQINQLLLGGQKGDGSEALLAMDQDADTSANLQGLSYSVEKGELQEQVASLKAQVHVLKASAEQAAAAAAAATSAASVGREHREAVASASSELVQLNLELQHFTHENQLLRHDIMQLEQRLQETEQQLNQYQDSTSHLQLYVHKFQQAEQQVAGLQEQVMQLQVAKAALEQDKVALSSRMQEQQRRLDEQAQKLASMQGAISEHNQDVKAALELVSRRESARGGLLKATSAAAIQPRLPLPAASALPPVASAPPALSYRPMSEGGGLSAERLGVPGTGRWARPTFGPGDAPPRHAWAASSPQPAAGPGHEAANGEHHSPPMGALAQADLPGGRAWQPERPQYLGLEHDIRQGLQSWRRGLTRSTDQFPGHSFSLSSESSDVDLGRVAGGGGPGRQADAASRDAVVRALAAVQASARKAAAGTPADLKMQQAAVGSASGAPRESMPEPLPRHLKVPPVEEGGAGAGTRISGAGRDDGTAVKAEQLRDDMQDLDQEIAQLEALLKRAASGLSVN